MSLSTYFIVSTVVALPASPTVGTSVLTAAVSSSRVIVRSSYEAATRHKASNVR
jgi:hypothetical protein